jgi:23S rRNA pseudouridine2605 synthase
VGELLRGVPSRLYPVGRLDFATSGVLLMTNDGDFANGLLHPRGGVPKTYVLKVQGQMSDEDLEPWRTGVVLEDGKTLPIEARILRREGDKTWLEITLREGKNQQIRRMGEATGWRVMRLARTSFAKVTSDGLRPGDWRPLSYDELSHIKKEFGVPRRLHRAPMPVAAPRRRAAPAAAPLSAGTPRTPVTPARTGRSGTTPRGAARRGPRARGREDR